MDNQEKNTPAPLDEGRAPVDGLKPPREIKELKEPDEDIHNPQVKLRKDASELIVITRAKQLVKYVFTATNKSPKLARFTFVNRMQNLGLDVIENLIRANDVLVKAGNRQSAERRRGYQSLAITNLKVMEYVASMALDASIVTSNQYVQIGSHQLSADHTKAIFNLYPGWQIANPMQNCIKK